MMPAFATGRDNTVQDQAMVRMELAAANRQILSAGVILTMALMPAFRSSANGLQPLAFAAASLISMAMAVTLHVWRGHIWQAWESSMQALVMQMAWSEDGPVSAAAKRTEQQTQGTELRRAVASAA